MSNKTFEDRANQYLLMLSMQRSLANQTSLGREFLDENEDRFYQMYNESVRTFARWLDMANEHHIRRIMDGYTKG